MNAARKRILVCALKGYLDQLVVFEDCNFRFVAIGSNHQFLTHLSPPHVGPMRREVDIRNALSLVAPEEAGDSELCDSGSRLV
jgi:hypothetical protein